MVLNLSALIVALLLFGVLAYLKRRGVSFLIRVLTATVFGIIVGLIFAGSTTYVAAMGTIYANLLKALVVPLLLFSIVSTLSTLKDTNELTNIGFKTLGTLGLHNVLGSIVTILFAFVVSIGVNANFEIPKGVETTPAPSFVESIVSFFPSNIVEHMASNQVIPIVVFALLLGFGILSFTDRTEIAPFVAFFDAGNKVIFTLTAFVTRFTPYAVLALIADKMVQFDMATIGSLLTVLLFVYVICIFHSVITTGAMIAIIGRLNPLPFLKKFLPVWITAASIQSSVGAIPANVEAQRKMGVSEKVASFAASIGATAGMPGCTAIWPVTLVIFTVNAFGIEYGITDYLILILVALFVSFGTVGVPGTATITATAVFTAVGLPVEMILVMTPISSIADMARTATNVTAAGSTGVIVANLQGELDHDLYKSKATDEDTVTEY